MSKQITVSAGEGLTVYGQPSCGPCKAVTAALDARGLTYAYIDVQASPEGAAALRALGYLTTPVTVTASGEHWGGFRLDRIDQLVGAV